MKVRTVLHTVGANRHSCDADGAIGKNNTATLEPEPDDGWMRNDLALTLARLRDHAECRKTLEPLSEMAAKSDAAIREDLLPGDADVMMSMIRATRTNLKLCQQAAKSR